MQKNVKLTPEQQLLVENNLSVVHWVIVNSIHVNPCIYGMSYEDLYQEGCIWLCRAAVTYNAAKALFSTYAKKVVRNGLISYCRRQCDKEKHYVHLEVGENGELLMGEADSSAMDSFTARISQIETLDLLESRKTAYQGVARLGIEALVLKIRGYSFMVFRPPMSAHGFPARHKSCAVIRLSWRLSTDLLKSGQSKP